MRRLEGEGPNPSGLCMCGCGELAPIARRAKACRGEIMGKPVRYIRGHRMRAKRVPPAIDPVTGCWVWQGTCRKADGRGIVGRRLAYRIVYELVHGPIPRGILLHHTCENPPCVNPAHLEPLTPAEHRVRHA